METWINKEQKYSGKVVSLVVGEARLEDGGVVWREVINHSGGVAIVPVIDDAVIMVRQFRMAIDREILEIPAGKIDPGEKPEDCARRELEEETGYKAGTLIPAGAFYPSVGYTDEIIHIFLCFELKKANQKLDSDERIRVEKISISDLKKKLAARQLEDSKTIIGLRELFAFLEDK
ncbi:MAG: ADP-ribose pyrophosphatase [candidate division Zixibacteria bacterium HGW-Zixibacteria-1]|nr:MAG: ADP-ribose pyrophosphatase [candidate division Zixibacteria bacterium HGW-Zixibacteria-1]